MKNKTAKEWLEEEGYGDEEYDINNLSLLFERFANYRTAELQADILNFRSVLNKMLDQMKGFYTKSPGTDRIEEIEMVLRLLDMHFGITEARKLD